MTATEFVERGFLGWTSGILGVLALLVMPLASCGPGFVKGHEILRNDYE